MQHLRTEMNLLKEQHEGQEEKHWREITEMKAEHERTVSALQLDSTTEVKLEHKPMMPVPKTLKNSRRSVKAENSEVRILLRYQIKRILISELNVNHRMPD